LVFSFGRVSSAIASRSCWMKTAMASLMRGASPLGELTPN
jgi:hypothetical protein